MSTKSHYDRVVVPALLADLNRRIAAGKTGHTTGRGTPVKAPAAAPAPTPTPESTATIPELVERMKTQVNDLQEKLSPTPYGRFRAPNGDEIVLPLQRPEERQFAPIKPYYERAKHDDGIDGDPHGDEKIITRRKEQDVERELDDLRKQRHRALPRDQAELDGQIVAKENELQQLRAERDAERRRMQSVIGDI